MKANPLGAQGEDFAAKTLAELGYKILERNFSSKYGEVDIIATQGDILAFVEVKTRKENSMVSGVLAVTAAKQRKIIATALWYMNIHTLDLQPRFDVFSVITRGKDIISHSYLEGAFDGEAYYKKYH